MVWGAELIFSPLVVFDAVKDAIKLSGLSRATISRLLKAGNAEQSQAA